VQGPPPSREPRAQGPGLVQQEPRFGQAHQSAFPEGLVVASQGASA
jgi:hypothetical protein